MKMPNFFIVGAPKAGTTAVSQYLSEHPEVFFSNPKEPHHFCTDLNYGDFKDKSEYEALFKDADEKHLAVGEASVWYLYSETAIPKIEKELPGSKYIVMIRNPIEMAPSLHMQNVYSGYEPIVEFEDAWETQKLRRKMISIPSTAREVKLLLYKEACSLGAQLTRLYENVERERVLVISLDELRDAPQTTWTVILRFLEISSDNRVDFPIVNAAKGRRSLYLKRMNDKYANVRRRLGLPSFGTGILKKIDRWNRVEGVGTELSLSMRQVLRGAFEPEIHQLEELTGKRWPGWLSNG